MNARIAKLEEADSVQVALVSLDEPHRGEGRAEAASNFLFETVTPKAAYEALAAAASAHLDGTDAEPRFVAEPDGPLAVPMMVVDDATLSAALTAADKFAFLLRLTCSFETAAPTKSPSDSPTRSPTDSPSRSPTDSPSRSPTKSPSDSPTKSPTDSP